MNVNGQSKKKNNKSTEGPSKEMIQAKQDSMLFDLAKRTGDYNIILNKLYEKASRKDSNITELTEIAYIYYEIKQFNLCINTCNIIISKEPLNPNGLELLAGSYQSIGSREKAIIAYQKLLSVKSSPVSHYNLATLYFETGNIMGSQEYLSKVLSDTTSLQHNIIINFQDVDQKQKQQVVNLAAAAYNMFAYILIENNKLAEGKQFLETALKISPEFALAKGNLIALNEKMNPSTSEENKKE